MLFETGSTPSMLTCMLGNQGAKTARQATMTRPLETGFSAFDIFETRSTTRAASTACSACHAATISSLHAQQQLGMPFRLHPAVSVRTDQAYMDGRSRCKLQHSRTTVPCVHVLRSLWRDSICTA